MNALRCDCCGRELPAWGHYMVNVDGRDRALCLACYGRLMGERRDA